MDPVVTARVPEGIRSRGVDVLKEIGSSTSELVNAAFAYVIQEHKLPKSKDVVSKASLRQVSAQQLAQARSFMEDVCIAVPQQWDRRTFEDLLEEVRAEQYESLR